MPTAIRLEGYRLFFYSKEGHEPPHIHIEQGENVAKFWLDPVLLARSRGFRAHELNRLGALVIAHQSEIMEAWREHFGGSPQS